MANWFTVNWGRSLASHPFFYLSAKCVSLITAGLRLAGDNLTWLSEMNLLQRSFMQRRYRRWWASSSKVNPPLGFAPCQVPSTHRLIKQNHCAVWVLISVFCRHVAKLVKCFKMNACEVDYDPTDTERMDGEEEPRSPAGFLMWWERACVENPLRILGLISAYID